MAKKAVLLTLKCVLIILTTYVIICWLIFIFWADVLYGPYFSGESHLRVVWKGMKESQLVDRLFRVGAKLVAVFDKNSKPIYIQDKFAENYYKDRFVFKSKPIVDKLYIYEFGRTRGWYWINEKKEVDWVVFEGISPL